MGFLWLSKLSLRRLERTEVMRLYDQGKLGKDLPATWRPWVELLEPLKGYSSVSGCGFIVPSGFVCDQASVPRLLAWIPGLVSTTGPHIIRAACLHDWRCPWEDEFGRRIANPAKGEILTHVQAAEELRQGMLADGASKRRANLVYWAVKNFGPKWEMPA